MSRVIVLLAMVGVFSRPASAQLTRDIVRYWDAAAGQSVTLQDGVITKESLAGVEYRVRAETRSIPTSTLERVEYGSLPGVSVSDLIVLRQFEEADDLPKFQAKIADLLKKVPARARSVLIFRDGMMLARAANRATDPAIFRPKADLAAKRLAEILGRPEASWEVWPASRTAARLYMEIGDFVEAARLLGLVAAIPGLPPELRYEAKLVQAGAALRAGAGAGVIDSLQRDSAFPPAGPLRDRLTVLAAAPDQLEPTLATIADPVARAVGFGRLGDWHRSAGRPDEARWAYLWVVMVYSADRDERVLALHRLVEVFEALGDPGRAARFRAELPAARS